MGAPRLPFGMEEVYSYPLYKGFGIASSRVGAFEVYESIFFIDPRLDYSSCVEFKLLDHSSI